METLAIVIDNPGQLDLRKVALREPAPGDVIVETHYSGVSTGTERLFWNGEMPFSPEWVILLFQVMKLLGW